MTSQDRTFPAYLNLSVRCSRTQRLALTTDLIMPCAHLHPSELVNTEHSRPIPLHVIFLLFRIRQTQAHLGKRITHLSAEMRETRPFRCGPDKGDIKEAQGILEELDRFSLLLLRSLSRDETPNEWVVSLAEKGREVMKVTPRVRKPELIGTCRF